MRKTWNAIRFLFVPALAIYCVAGCASHDHHSVRTYDYREDDDSQSRGDRAPRSELNSEYQMVSPGEMASPGRPVVDPR
jgi:hypothetical protein